MRSAVARQPDPQSQDQVESADFALSDEEVAKGAHAVGRYLESIKPDDTRKSAAEALDMLALVISAGVCSSTEFPWHQMRAHHGAAAISILKQFGTPARVESYLCQKDQSRRSRRTPDSYPSSQVQRARHSLRRVLAECTALGFVDPEEGSRTMALLKNGKGELGIRGRMITDSEFRALIAVCARDNSPAGLRDALLLRLGYQGGLRLSEIVALTMADLHFHLETNRVTLDVRGSRDVKKRSVEICNEALITIEDWLGSCDGSGGPLLRSIVRGKVENKRMKGADVRLVCESRAEQAGVELFSPQDLRRRVAAGRPAVLYQADIGPATNFMGQIQRDPDQAPTTLAFPYPGRSG